MVVGTFDTQNTYVGFRLLFDNNPHKNWKCVTCFTRMVVRIYFTYDQRSVIIVIKIYIMKYAGHVDLLFRARDLSFFIDILI